MADVFTPVLNLVKPDFEGAADVRELSGNMDILDTFAGTVQGAIVNPMSAPGDLVVGGTAGAPGRLAAGANGSVLKLAAGTPAWQADVGFANPMTTAQDLVVGGASGAAARLGVGANAQVLQVVGGVLTWANNPAGFVNPMSAQGDLIAGGAGGAAQRLGVGGTGQVLAVAAGAPAWASQAEVTAAGLRVVPLGTVAAPSVRIGTEQTGFYAQETSSTNRSLALTVNGEYKISVNAFDAAGTTQFLFGPKTTTILPATDGTHSLGNVSQKYAVLYATNGTIQTSSKTVKEDWTPLPPEDALAVARSTAVGTFKYKNAPETRLGFLAEDTDPLLTLDGRSADAQTTASLALCALGALAERYDALLARLSALESGGGTTTAGLRPAWEADHRG